jgi:hypothetical protein
VIWFTKPPPGDPHAFPSPIWNCDKCGDIWFKMEEVDAQLSKEQVLVWRRGTDGWWYTTVLPADEARGPDFMPFEHG